MVSLAGAVTSLRAVGKLKGRAATGDGNATKQPRKCGEDNYDNYDDYQDDEPPTAVADKPLRDLRTVLQWTVGFRGPGFKQATA